MTADERPPTPSGSTGQAPPADAQQDREDRYAAWAKRLRDDKRTLVDSFHTEDPDATDEAAHPWSRQSRAAAAEAAAPPDDAAVEREPSFDMGLLMRSNEDQSSGSSGGTASSSDERSGSSPP